MRIIYQRAAMQSHRDIYYRRSICIIFQDIIFVVIEKIDEAEEINTIRQLSSGC